ncbi:MAG: histidine kinase [bacterium]|nr:histidine kinase [bacterium]
MSRTEKYLPFILALILPLLSSLHKTIGQSVSTPEIGIPRYFVVCCLLLTFWYYNKSLVFYDTKLIKAISRPIALVLVNLLVVIAMVSVEFFLVPDIWSLQEIVPPWLFGIRLSVVIVAFVMILFALKSLREREVLKRQNLALQSISLKAQLETLKQQLNPHFLFNSLNTLIDLIEDDPESAVEFVRHFSYIYRVVLQSSKHDMVSLKDEMDFLEVYWKLLQTRFKDGIKLHIDVDEESLEKQIPPLSLQLLIENAVKHNEISKNKPLVLTVSSNESNIVVENTYTPKKFSVNGEGFGLQNLTERFEYLTQLPIEYGVHGDKYRVVLPLKN